MKHSPLWLTGVLVAYTAACVYALLSDLLLSSFINLDMPLFPLNR